MTAPILETREQMLAKARQGVELWTQRAKADQRAHIERQIHNLEVEAKRLARLERRSQRAGL